MLPNFFQYLILIFLLFFGAWRVMEGHLTIGMLIALMILMSNLLNPMTRLVNFNQVAQFLKVNIARIDDVLKNQVDPGLATQEEKEEERLKQLPFSKLKGSVELRNVTFTFDPMGDPIFKNINLHIAPGTFVGIVGATGSGKSTLSKILSCLFEPQEGEVIFNGIPKKSLPRGVITNSLALVEQEIYFFPGTVKDNIALFNPIITQQEIINAAQQACIHDQIVQRNDAYDLLLIKNGANFSGGERQRLEIARALVKKPSILILDEATSSLDTDTEIQVMQNIRHLGCTCIVIAHRLSTISYCDDVIVLDEGSIVQRGTPDELKDCRIYPRTY